MTGARRPASAGGDLHQIRHYPQYAVRLAERLRLECDLAADARHRGWDREIDRHQRIADCVRALLTELGEPCDPHEETP